MHVIFKRGHVQNLIPESWNVTPGTELFLFRFIRLHLIGTGGWSQKVGLRESLKTKYPKVKWNK